MEDQEKSRPMCGEKSLGEGGSGEVMSVGRPGMVHRTGGLMAEDDCRGR